MGCICSQHSRRHGRPYKTFMAVYNNLKHWNHGKAIEIHQQVLTSGDTPSAWPLPLLLLPSAVLLKPCRVTAASCIPACGLPRANWCQSSHESRAAKCVSYAWLLLFDPPAANSSVGGFVAAAYTPDDALNEETVRWSPCIV